MVIAPFTENGRGAVVTVVCMAPIGAFQLCAMTCINRGPASWICGGYVTGSEGEVMGPQVLIGDEFLRPIRDPGDDAVDEILERVGAPAGLIGMPSEEVSHG